MANVKITELPAAGTLDGTEVVPLVQGTTSKRTTAADIAALVDVPDAYTLPTASTTVLGGVKVDGSTITIADGVISGATPTSTLDGLTDVTITTPADGHVLTYDGSGWVNEAPAGGGSGGLGVYGNGADGAATLDGTTNYTNFSSRSTSTYTLIRDAYFTDLTVNAGVILKTAGYRVFVKGTLTNNGQIHQNGGTGGAPTAGTNATTGTVGGSGGGPGAGGTGANGSSGTGATNYIGGNGASGGASGGGQVGGSPTNTGLADSDGGVGNAYALPQALLGSAIHGTTIIRGGAPGGGGGGAASSTGGGGGAGGGVLIIAAATVAGSGSIEAKGGNGGNATGTNAGGGGAGGGGVIVLVTRSGTSSGSKGTATATVGGVTLDVSGGTGGAKVGTGTVGGNGSAGVISVIVTG